MDLDELLDAGPCQISSQNSAAEKSIAGCHLSWAVWKALIYNSIKNRWQPIPCIGFKLTTA